MAQNNSANTFLTGTDLHKTYKNEEPVKKARINEQSSADKKLRHDEARKEEAWQQIKNRVCFKQGNDSYSDYKVKPGFDFWELIAKSSQKKLDMLRIKIPDTVLIFHNNSFCYLRTDGITGKIIKKGEEVNLSEVEKVIIDNDPFFNRPIKESDTFAQAEREKRYFMCSRTSGGLNEMSFNMPSDLLTLTGWKSKSNTEKLQKQTILQQYIYPTGKKACITRFVYKTKHNKGDMANKKDPNRSRKKWPFRDGDNFNYTDREGKSQKFKTEFEKNDKGKITSIKMKDSNHVAFECYEPQLLISGQLCQVRFFDKSLIFFDKFDGIDKKYTEGTEYKTVQVFMPDKWTIRCDFKAENDFINDDKPGIESQSGPYNIPNLQANYALKLRNVHDLHEGKQSISKSAILNKDIEHSFTVSQITGAPLKDFENIAEKLIEFIERQGGVRIMVIV